MPEKKLQEKQLAEILRDIYHLGDVSLRFLREGGGQTWLAEGAGQYLVKVINPAFAETVRSSVRIMRYLEENGFPVPGTLLTQAGEALHTGFVNGETRLISVQEYIEGDEPDLRKSAEEAGALTGQLHSLLEKYPDKLVERDRHFFIGRYLDFLRRKEYPRLQAYEELGNRLWEQVRDLPRGRCHGDLHRGNLLQSPDGKIHVIDFDTVCSAPVMFDVAVMCDMTDYFRLRESDMAVTEEVYARFLTGYSRYRTLNRAEQQSFHDWVAVRHFQLQATIVELYGMDCIDGHFIDSQLDWLNRWMKASQS